VEAERHPEHQYLDLLRELIAKSERTAARANRTEVAATSVFGRTLRFDLGRGFPVLTTKKVYWRLAAKEILWMLRGGTNIRDLLLGTPRVRIWTDWPLRAYRAAGDAGISQEAFEQRIVEDAGFAARWGELGPVYGKQWRAWEAKDGRVIDQVARSIETLRARPTDRRIIWEGWNVGEIDAMARTGLPPCHKTYQWFVEDGRLGCHLSQRSADTFLGVPFNILNLALLVHLMADHLGLEPGEAIWHGTDVHLYRNHLEQARLQVGRDPRPWPRLAIRTRREHVWDYQVADLALEGYRPHEPIDAAVAV
jgi:thymidylate synthase